MSKPLAKNLHVSTLIEKKTILVNAQKGILNYHQRNQANYLKEMAFTFQ